LASTPSIDRVVEWTIYILECADGTYSVGFCRDLRVRLKEIAAGEGSQYFLNRPDRLPVKLLYEEPGLPFREAYAKFRYLRTMPRRLKEKLIYKKKWPLGGELKEFLKRQSTKSDF
jgi:putative endonuclease